MILRKQIIITTTLMIMMLAGMSMMAYLTPIEPFGLFVLLFLILYVGLYIVRVKSNKAYLGFIPLMILTLIMSITLVIYIFEDAGGIINNKVIQMILFRSMGWIAAAIFSYIHEKVSYKNQTYQYSKEVSRFYRVLWLSAVPIMVFDLYVTYTVNFSALSHFVFIMMSLVAVAFSGLLVFIIKKDASLTYDMHDIAIVLSMFLYGLYYVISIGFILTVIAIGMILWSLILNLKYLLK